MIDFSAATAVFRSHFGLACPAWGAADGFRPSSHQVSPRQIKIGQTDQRKHLRGVLRDALVAHFRVTELALDHAKQMFDSRTDRRHSVIEPFISPSQRVRFARLELTQLAEVVPTQFGVWS